MTGVASPMLRAFPQRGLRFLAGLLVGGASAGLVLSLVFYLFGTAANALLPGRERLLVVACVAAVLGLADIVGRTPNVSRQVPQRLVRSVPAGFLGLAWGFDLGLLFTTQKTTSLIWLALAISLFMSPASSPLVLIAIAIGVGGTVVVASVTLKGEMARIERPLLIEGRHLALVRNIRKASGVLIVAIVPILAWQAIVA